MSKIDEMLKQHCPEGVERKPLGQLLEVEKGKQLNKGSLFETGDYPVINGGINPSGFWNEYNFAENQITISQGGASAGYVNWLSTRFWAGAHCYVLTNTKNLITYRYAYYVVKSAEKNLMSSQIGAGIPCLRIDKITAIPIPLPPRPVQDEIVKALDAMDAAVKALVEERAARQEQFEAVMEDVFEKLLSQGVKQEPFSIHSEYIRGITYSKNDETENEKDSFVVLRANNITLECCDINLEDVKRVASTVRIKREQFLKLGDVLICAGSGSKAHIGKVAYVDKNYEFAFGGFMAVIRSDAMLNNKFTFYVLRSNGFKSFLKRRLSGGAAINNLDASIMNEFSVPVPPRPVQDEIVKVLDAMDAVVKALDEEIAARREQFAGWLEKLMKFDAKEVA